ncbi:GNAT family N-acetyltransferase [Robiginitalea sp. M366]|uniref:GNAT family N-acetyltransferase n=1 Tax=Robiginitalea aestuariiviva TaxID=3036903 RepID=UPI00240E53AD|nr:GNAT family N-acetyltransferase [Robiginitalea aestuariiviva]MDG1572176.1 GNAT family N-acetyltransferase [Robiginitalea aestuariiviva]
MKRPPKGWADWSATPERFFDALPEDWAVEAREIWPKLGPESRILVYAPKAAFKAGGILTQSLLPEMETYGETARGYYRRGFWYVGFLYVHPKARGQGLGGQWLEQAWQAVPARGLWLGIETLGLLKFYTQSGFHLDHILHVGTEREWLLSRSRDGW